MYIRVCIYIEIVLPIICVCIRLAHSTHSLPLGERVGLKTRNAPAGIRSWNLCDKMIRLAVARILNSRPRPPLGSDDIYLGSRSLHLYFKVKYYLSFQRVIYLFNFLYSFFYKLILVIDIARKINHKIDHDYDRRLAMR